MTCAHLTICDECQPERLKSFDLSQGCASPNCGEGGFGNAAAVVPSGWWSNVLKWRVDPGNCITKATVEVEFQV